MATIWLLGDQCSWQQPWLKNFDPGEDRVVMIEARSRSSWQNYHKQKLVLVYSVMRHFRDELRNEGITVDYRQGERFDEELAAHIREYHVDELRLQLPGDDRMRRKIEQWADENQELDVRMAEEYGFLVDRAEWPELLPDEKKWQMDSFYRLMRRRFNVLITEEGKPFGGKWSLDAENRKPPKEGISFPEPEWIAPDEITREVIEEVEAHFPENYGETAEFSSPVTAEEAERFFEHFVEQRLLTFGDYQDAMVAGDPFMSHSMISTSINMKLLDPLAVIRRVERAYEEGLAPLNAVEGFIRQVLGWREFIRGVYIRRMPAYQEVNALEHHRDLPEFFWTADTKMNCLHESVSAVVNHGYSHHIQRLMVLGNFATLAGIEPKQVSDWFNEMYIDAYDWVVLPNVLGMALYADGGQMSTKPYVSSGNYINKMSDYCQSCVYNIKEKTGDNACPFHALYWDFLERHGDKFRAHPRMKVMYKHLDNRTEETAESQRTSAARIFERLAEGEL
ncbi:cryptochrome/photolyase family protein [Salisediminibacterium halotolerans]|uniref:cryptochrome/photolyase family protein n=1 Tax=Salisediminibacterium halotolerans TaxID=517425 RepID=UPI000EB326AD|nr:cryptochrome/photolyase family protein [Salisediminibacterium halotolerans]